MVFGKGGRGRQWEEREGEGWVRLSPLVHSIKLYQMKALTALFVSPSIFFILCLISCTRVPNCTVCTSCLLFIVLTSSIRALIFFCNCSWLSLTSSMSSLTRSTWTWSCSRRLSNCCWFPNKACSICLVWLTRVPTVLCSDSSFSSARATLIIIWVYKLFADLIFSDRTSLSSLSSLKVSSLRRILPFSSPCKRTSSSNNALFDWSVTFSRPSRCLRRPPSCAGLLFLRTPFSEASVIAGKGWLWAPTVGL